MSVDLENTNKGVEYATSNIIDKGLDLVRQSGALELVENRRSGIARTGFYALYTAAILGLIVALVFSIRSDVLLGVRRSSSRLS